MQSASLDTPNPDQPVDTSDEWIVDLSAEALERVRRLAAVRACSLMRAALLLMMADT